MLQTEQVPSAITAAEPAAATAAAGAVMGISVCFGATAAAGDGTSTAERLAAARNIKKVPTAAAAAQSNSAELQIH
jgi:hypothetical protein